MVFWNHLISPVRCVSECDLLIDICRCWNGTRWCGTRWRGTRWRGTRWRGTPWGWRMIICLLGWSILRIIIGGVF
jgi:hypothetical protein